MDPSNRTTVGLRVDVDTRRGLDEGVPRLLELFRHRRVRASFFVTMGPDHSGRAIRRALLRRIAGEGHEVAPHGWDQVGWQDRIHRLDRLAIRADLDLAARAVAAVVGVAPHASAAPGWRPSAVALAVQDDLGFHYASDTRGETPFRPKVGDGVLATLQVPTTMPTMDELLGRVPDVPGTLARAVRPGVNVFTLHAEVEGGALLAAFETFLVELGRRGVAFAGLDDVAARALAAADEVPAAPVVRGSVDGRSGWIAAQAWARRGEPSIR